MPRYYINPDSPRVSILTLREYYDKRILSTLASIYSNTYPITEVIIINIGATDKIVKDLYKHYPNIKQISLQANTEKELAFKEGQKIAQGEFLLFLDSTVEEINTTFIEELIVATRKSSRIALIVPQLRSFNSKEQVLFNANLFSQNIKNYINYNSLTPVRNADDIGRFIHIPCTEAFLVSKSYLEKIEEELPSGIFLLDEVDIAETVKENRFKIYYEPKSIAYINNAVADPQTVYYKTRNRLASIRKHKTGIILIGMLALFSVSSIPKHTIHNLLHLRLYHMLAFYKGVLWNVLHSVKTGNILTHFKWKYPF